MADGIALSIDLDAREALGGIQALARAGDPNALHPAWDAIGLAMVKKTQERFQSGTGPDGVAWVPSKRALKTGGKTLIDTARLYLSYVHNALPNGVEWGSNVVYAAIHQLGGTINIFARSQRIYRKVNKSGEIGNRFVKKSQSNFASDHAIGAHKITIPARPSLGIDAEDIAEAESMLTLQLSKSIADGARGFTG